MAKINICEAICENCITIEDGEKLFKRIHPELITGRPVELDFTKISVFASPFFNAAIGQLLKDIKPEDLNHLLKISNLTPAGTEVLKRVIENSKQYYLDNGKRKALDAILKEHTEDK